MCSSARLHWCNCKASQFQLTRTPLIRGRLCTLIALNDAYGSVAQVSNASQPGSRRGLLAQLAGQCRTRHLGHRMWRLWPLPFLLYAYSHGIPVTRPLSPSSPPTSPTVACVSHVPPHTFLSCNLRSQSLPPAQRIVWTYVLQQWALPGLPRRSCRAAPCRATLNVPCRAAPKTTTRALQTP